jgi:hypothetical protein
MASHTLSSLSPTCSLPNFLKLISGWSFAEFLRVQDLRGGRPVRGV